MAAARHLLTVAAPWVLFAALCAARPGTCVEQYLWDGQRGPVPEGPACGATDRLGPTRSIPFAVRATVSALFGKPGYTRLSHDPWPVDLSRRAGRSGATVGVACAVAWLGVWLARRLSRTWRGWAGPRTAMARWVPAPNSALRGWGWLPVSLPVPLAAFVVFAAVVRSMPPGHALDWERAPALWAGLALALGDGVVVRAFGGSREALDRAERAPWGRAQALAGLPVPRIAREVAAEERAAHWRSAFWSLLAGLLVVEGVFGVNGLGEASADLVVDRAGLDPLALWGMLVVASAIALVVQAAPLERWLARWEP